MRPSAVPAPSRAHRPLWAPDVADRLASRLGLLNAHLFVLTTFLDGALLGAPWGGAAAADAVGRALALLMAAIAATILALRPAVARAVAARCGLLALALGLAIVSVVWSAHPELTLRRAGLQALLALAALSIVISVDDPRAMRLRLLGALTPILLADLAALGIGAPFAQSDIGFKGVHASKNLAGLAMLLLLTCAGVAAVRARNVGERGFAALLAAGAAVVLVASESKTSIALAALALGLGLPFLALRRAAPGFAALAAVGAAIALTLGALAIVALGWDRADVLTLLLGDPTLTKRTDIWAFVWRDIEPRWLLGHGYGAYWDVGPVADPLRRAPDHLWLGQVEPGVINQAHNGYLELMLGLGIVGALLVGAAYAQALARAYVGAITGRASAEAATTQAMAAITIAAFFVHNLTEASMLSRNIAIGNLVLLLAILAARADRADR